MSDSIAEVAVPRDIGRTFDYEIPVELLEKARWGTRVRVSFSGDELTGFIVGLKSTTDFKGKLLAIKRVIDEEPIIDEHRFELALWISTYYLTPLGMVLAAMIPAGVHKRSPRKRNYVHLNVDLEDALKWIERLSSSAPKQIQILKSLLERSRDPLMKDLLSDVDATSGPLKSLEKKGIVKIVRTPISHAVTSAFRADSQEFELSSEQQKAIAVVRDALSLGHRKLLLHGVNASGKTEVYLRAVQLVLERGMQAVIAVPEISLTPQLISRCEERFGERLAVYHSQLTEAQRSHEWQRIQNGEADVVIGVRSALFAPLEKLGLIIIDEEHEPTYKQEDPAPRYHAREVAERRVQLANAVLLMGSATPALETYRRTEVGGIQLIEMKERVVGRSLPQVQLIEMKGEKRILSPQLHEAISSKIAVGEQVMLLLNLRGFSRALLCLSCREIQRCPNCNLALVYHLKEQRLVCHVCGHDFPVGHCRNCKSENLMHIGAGTEKVEHELRELFPGVAIARMDSDSLSRGEHDEILEALRRGEIQILLGTQMIALGLDFPNVNLVGILSADTMLNITDFRAGERTFQLISQAIGRAGRGGQAGLVIIQTHQPEHYAITHAIQHDYLGFYREELALREAFGYPPYRRLIKISVEHRSEERATADVERLRNLINFDISSEHALLEPFKAVPYRLRGDIRWQLVIKTNSLKSATKWLKELLDSHQFASSLRIDVDPQSLVF